MRVATGVLQPQILPDPLRLHFCGKVVEWMEKVTDEQYRGK